MVGERIVSSKKCYGKFSALFRTWDYVKFVLSNSLLRQMHHIDRPGSGKKTKQQKARSKESLTDWKSSCLLQNVLQNDKSQSWSNAEEQAQCSKQYLQSKTSRDRWNLFRYLRDVSIFSQRVWAYWRVNQKYDKGRAAVKVRYDYITMADKRSNSLLHS